MTAAAAKSVASVLASPGIGKVVDSAHKTPAGKKAADAVAVVAKADVAQMEHLEKVRELGVGIQKAYVNLGEKFLDLCRYVRKNQVPPSDVSKVLGELGFKKQRIYEINKVAQVAPELWNEYEARNLGMKGVLQLANAPEAQRMIAKEAGISAGALEEDEGFQKVVGGDKADARGAAKDGISAADALAAKRNGMFVHAKSILSAAEKLAEGGWTEKQIQFHQMLGGDYVLKLEKLSKNKAAIMKRIIAAEDAQRQADTKATELGKKDSTEAKGATK